MHCAVLILIYSICCSFASYDALLLHVTGPSLLLLSIIDPYTIYSRSKPVSFRFPQLYTFVSLAHDFSGLKMNVYISTSKAYKSKSMQVLGAHQILI